MIYCQEFAVDILFPFDDLFDAKKFNNDHQRIKNYICSYMQERMDRRSTTLTEQCVETIVLNRLNDLCRHTVGNYIIFNNLISYIIEIQSLS